MISPEQLEQIYRTLRAVSRRVAEDEGGGEQALTHGSLYVRDVSDLLAEVDRLSTLLYEGAGRMTEGEWIPVSERLPDTEDYVLVWLDGVPDTGMYYQSKAGRKRWNLNALGFRSPELWQPLPKPPTTEVEQNG